MTVEEQAVVYIDALQKNRLAQATYNHLRRCKMGDSAYARDHLKMLDEAMMVGIKWENNQIAALIELERLVDLLPGVMSTNPDVTKIELDRGS